MNIIIEVRSKADGPRAEALATAQVVYSIREFEVYHDRHVTVLDLEVPVEDADPAVFDEFVERLRYHGLCMVCFEVCDGFGAEIWRTAYGTRQGPGAS